MEGEGGFRLSLNWRSAIMLLNESMHSVGVRCLPVIPQPRHIEGGTRSLASSRSVMFANLPESRGSAHGAF